MDDAANDAAMFIVTFWLHKMLFKNELIYQIHKAAGSLV